MDIKPYPKGEPTKQARSLFKKGILRKYPEQVGREDLLTDEGVDIVYYLKGVTPSVFQNVVDELLLAAYAEGERYKDAAYKFAKFTIEMDLNSKGRTAGISTVREYIAAKNPETETMVWGTGVDLPEGFKNPFLVGKSEEIINILKDDSPGPYLKRKNPYKVTSMTISIRAGKSAHIKALVKKMREDTAERIAELKREEGEV